MKSPHFCYEPWIGIDIDNFGYIKPCCKFDITKAENWQNYNLQNIKLEDYKKSEGLSALKNSFLSGEKPTGCERCWRDESANYASKRQLDYQNWQKNFDDINLENPQTLLLTIPLSNICNLKCRICGPYSSSSWIKEYKDLYGEKISNNLLESSENWKEILDICDNILEFHFHGGEPFLYDEVKHLELLDRLVNSDNKNKIKIHYSTNGTIFPSEKYWNYFKQLNLVDIQISVDDIGHRFDYNRKNADWKEVEKNLFLFRDKTKNQKNIKLSISTTVSVFTIFYMEEIFDYFFKNKLPKPWLGRLSKPNYYKCNIFSLEHRNLIKNKLETSKHKDLRKISFWLNEDESYLKDKFINTTKKHDLYRKESFEHTFPEIYEWLFK